MIMIAVLHEVLLMVILQMLLPLISNEDWFPLLLACTKAKMLASRHYASKRITSRHLLSFVRFALQSKVPMSAIISSMLQYSKCNPILMPNILLLTRVGSLSKKKKGRFFMTNFCHIFYALVMILYTLPWFLWHHLLQRRGFWVQQLIPHVLGAKNEIYYSLLLFICHYSLLLFTVTVHSEILPI